MGNGDQNLVDADLFGKLARAAPDIYERLATFLIQNLNVQPADPFHKAGTENFHDGFFCCPASGKRFVAVLPLLAVSNFFGCVDSINEAVGVPLDHLRYSSDLDNVRSKSDDHRKWAFRNEVWRRDTEAQNVESVTPAVS